MKPTTAKRALRRHHLERHKAKARKVLHWQDRSFSSEREEALVVGKWAHTPKACSCWMCGNPRKHWKEATWQEQKADAATRVA